MASQAIALTLSIGGALNSSATRAFSGAGRLFDGVGRRVEKLQDTQADLRKELARVRREQRKAFDPADVENYRKEVERLEGELKRTGRELDTLSRNRERAFGRARRFGGIAAAGAGLGLGIGAAAFGIQQQQTERAREVQRAGLTSGLGTGAVQNIANFGVASGVLDEQNAVERAADVGRELRNRLGEAATEGQGATFDALQRTGLDAAELLTELEQDSVATILKIGTAIEDAFGASAQFGFEEVFGGAEAEYVAGILSLTEAERELTQQRADRRAFFTDEEISTLTDADNAMRALRGAGADLGKTLATSLAPVIQSIAEAITPIITGITEWAKENPALAKTVALVAGGILAAVTAIAAITAAVFAFQAVWVAFNILFAATPIGFIIIGIVAAVALLVGIGYVLYRNWDTIMAFLGDAWQGFLGIFTGVIDALKAAWNGYVGLIFDGVRSIISFFDPLFRAISFLSDAFAAIGIGEGIDISADSLNRELDAIERRITFDATPRAGSAGSASADAQPAVSETNVTVNVNAPTQEELPDLTANAISQELALAGRNR